MSYNLSQLRILWEISSDGNKWANITSSSRQVDGDFNVYNLKSDIIEQVWRSFLDEDGSAWFIVDCGSQETGTAVKAVTFDTVALLNHNLSPSAKVYLYGWGNADTNTPPTKAQMLSYTESANGRVTLLDGVSPYNAHKDLLYVQSISENTRTVSKARRYWMLRVVDPANTNSTDDGVDGNGAVIMKPFIQLGRFIAGQATILTTQENITSSITYREVSYKDEVKLTGFTSVSNARSMKKKVKVSLKNINAISSSPAETSNYTNIKRFIRYCRDTLKSLVIIDSRSPYQFYAYAKLTETPSEECNYLDDSSLYVSMDLEWDEAQ